MVEKRPHIKTIPYRRGIAMIELIFSLVIMGIVLLSAPMLIQQSINSGNIALQQEAIVAAASQTSVILSMHWDENNNSNSAVSPMLDVNRAPFDFVTIPLQGLKSRGLNGVDGRSTTKTGGATLPPTLSADFGMDPTADENTTETDFTDFDDVDDYDGSNFSLTVFNDETTTADVGDYVDVNISMSTAINYTEDRVTSMNTTPLNGTTLNLKNNINKNDLATETNIKFIRVNLTSKSGIKELEKDITFEAFSCNIGTSLPQGSDHL